MTVVQDDHGYLVRVTENGVEQLTVQGLRVRSGFCYCGKCPYETADESDLSEHYQQEHGHRGENV